MAEISVRAGVDERPAIHDEIMTINKDHEHVSVFASLNQALATPACALDWAA